MEMDTAAATTTMRRKGVHPVRGAAAGEPVGGAMPVGLGGDAPAVPRTEHVQDDHRRNPKELQDHRD